MLLVFMILLASCASTSSLNEFQDQAIERTRTLPKDVSAWRFIYAQSLDRERNNYVYPLYWEHGITERLTLVWMPLPFEFHYLLQKDERQSFTLGASLLGSAYARDKDFVWRPSLQVGWKRRLADRLAFEGELFGQSEVKRSTKNTLAWDFALRGGLQYQPFRRLAIGASLLVLEEYGETLARYLGEVPPGNRGEESQSWRLRYPVEIDLTLTLHRQWEIQGNLQIFRFGYPAGYTGLPLYLSLVHYW